jgi:predicted Rossmann fold nucleotide-binding protein DprA/Smf involved in DNA uptake
MMQLTNDAYALIMACSYAGLDRKSTLTPLTLKEWNTVAQKIVDSGRGTPGHFLGLSAAVLQKELALQAPEAERLAALLDRGAAVGLELEKLMNAGIQITTRADGNYPKKLKEKLQAQAPPVLFYAGALSLSEKPGVAIVGSRAVDPAGAEFTAGLAALCARNRLSVVSGGAKGVDIISMKTVLDNGGRCVGAVSDSLARKIREPAVRQYLFDDQMLLLAPFHPDVPFQVANAMSRNKLIYALGDYAVAVASEVGKGGTWAGATENLRKGYTPLFVRAGGDVPQGNLELLKKGALGLTGAEIENEDVDLAGMLEEKILESGADKSPQAEQLGLF